MKGNVYVQYENIEDAINAFTGMNGRFYAQKPLTPEFCPIDNWKSAICGSYEAKKCERGKACNFLHLYSNPSIKK